jgi:hypothetical protein
MWMCFDLSGCARKVQRTVGIEGRLDRELREGFEGRDGEVLAKLVGCRMAFVLDRGGRKAVVQVPLLTYRSNS